MDKTPHQIALEIAAEDKDRNYNEADTRHKIIDAILHKVLTWPVKLTFHESYIDEGYADYRLKKSTGEDLLLIEAKKEGVYFNLPNNFNGHKKKRHVAIKTLLTDSNIKKAVEQVRGYCMEEGCLYAGITNGHEWIFFKTFEPGKNWRDLKALVIKENGYFAESYTEAVNTLGFEAIKNGLHRQHIGNIGRQNREVLFPKEKIPNYDSEVISNDYARLLRPFARKYFGDITVAEQEFMEACYVRQRDYDASFDNFRLLIKDSLTPYFKEHGVQDFIDNEKGGQFGNRLSKSIREKKTGEVIILFGGKGAGKSTFLRKLLYHNPPQYLTKYSRVAIADLLKVPENKDEVYASIWHQTIDNLDTDELLKGDRELLLKLFNDRFDIAKRQDLFGLDEKSEAYNLKLNGLVSQWISDKKYIARRLIEYWRTKHTGCIVVVDNTDQFDQEIQDLCFMTAQEIANELNCLVIISMREERFYYSKMHGTLDAYQNSGFHISSPVTQAVFEKRINFVLDKLEEISFCNDEFPSDTSSEEIEAIKKLFKILRHEFSMGDQSPLTNFLNACAHGNIRVALELFRDFLKSGYTNVDEMVGIDGLWTLRIHQVLKPVMIPYRFFYDENQSSIPNIFQLRSKQNGSHFTGLRILKYLSNGIDRQAPHYVAISQLRDYFADTFNMVDDFEKNLDIFLMKNLVESNNRLDFYSKDVDSIKITNYGLYIFEVLSSFFTYIELISSDCSVYDETTAYDLAGLSNDDYRLFYQKRRLERVDRRLDKAQVFIDYLIKEEQAEQEFFGNDIDLFMPHISESFEAERVEVLRSAGRQRRG